MVIWPGPDPFRAELLMRLSTLLLALAVLAATGCGYTSQYVPPNDGRARVVWRDGSVAALVPNQSSEACMAAVQQASGTADPRAGDLQIAANGAEVQVATHVHVVYPIYVEPVPLLPPPPPVEVYAHEPHASVAHEAEGPHRAVAANAPSEPSRPAASSRSSSRHASDASDAAADADYRLFVVGAVVAIVAMPAIAVALAVDEPERPVETAASIDLVNAYNDAAYTSGNPCFQTAGVAR
jgi:hypothetical protein